MTQIPSLPVPPPLAPGTLRIVPLGGLGEVGRNMAVLEIDGRLLVIDRVDPDVVEGKYS